MSLDDFLAEEVPRQPGSPPAGCKTCGDFSHLNPDILEFLDRKASGKLHLPVFSSVSRKCLWHYLVSRGYSLGNSSLIRHISLCLRRDHKTGRPLD